MPQKVYVNYYLPFLNYFPPVIPLIWVRLRKSKI